MMRGATGLAHVRHDTAGVRHERRRDFVHRRFDALAL
jgi:hypothetical protein